MKPLSQMTEEELKTLCKSLEARYCENSTVTIKQPDFNNMWDSIDRYAKENKRLQEQLADANEVINDDLREANSCFAVGRIRKYKEKWGVK